jgi:hypothetical protein
VLWTQQVDATPSNTDLLFEGGVIDPREVAGVFCGAEGRRTTSLKLSDA